MTGSRRYRTHIWLLAGVAAVLVLGIVPVAMANGVALTPMEQLGKSIFFDMRLSINENQACAACHDPAAGWTGPIGAINAAGAVYEGSIPGRFGNRKPPSSAYASFSPILYVDKSGTFIGGNFWDGRATGEKLGNPAADQAQGPFLNPLEQGTSDSACIVWKVETGDYPVTYADVWGPTGIDWPADMDVLCATEGALVPLTAADRAASNMAYDRIALSIEAFEASPESNAFTSKFDAWKAGQTSLTRQEIKGFALFVGKAKCSRCHIAHGTGGMPALFTDFTYDNLGIPRNPDNPFYAELSFNPLGAAWVDLGLGGFLESRAEYADYADANMGKEKVPTLRNVDKRTPGLVKAYGHNGYFKSLEEIVHFYNTRDVPGAGWMGTPWPAPEVSENVNTSELGDLGLSESDEAALVAFLKTLTDGWMAP
jgi:cytochrome c peroxidase